MSKNFSDRIGVSSGNVRQIQVDSMDSDLKNSLWNCIHQIYHVSTLDAWRDLAQFIAINFRKSPVDEVPYHNFQCIDWLKEYFYILEWNRVYEMIELVTLRHPISKITQLNSAQVKQLFNQTLSRELSGYRFMSEGLLLPITDSVEIQEIDEAIQITSIKGIDGAHQHIKSALSLLGKKPDPDYRNSIKESISAVEAIVKQLSGSGSQGLAGALAELDKTFKLHGSLKEGFKKLYGYSSDEDGIRHAILELPDVGMDEAKYMIVSCSAFVNYLVAKADKYSLFEP